VHWSPNILAALLLLAMILALYIPDFVAGIRTFKQSRDLARRITEEHAAREFLEQRARAEQ
jgi:hypothetical protein